MEETGEEELIIDWESHDSYMKGSHDKSQITDPHTRSYFIETWLWMTQIAG